MADDASASEERLQAELRQLRAELAASRAEAAGLRDDVSQRDRALAEASERQTATAEILRIIAGSAADLETVLQAIVDRALRLGDAAGARIFLAEGDALS